MSEVSEDDLTPDWTPEHSIDPQPLDHVHQFEEKRSLLTSGSFRQSSGSIDEDKDRTSFWNSFLGFPEREINTEQFSRRIWLGIPNQWGIRAQAWPLLCPRIDQAVEFSKTLIRREELSPEIVSSTTLELERENALLRLEANPFLVDAKAIDMLVLATHCVLEKKKQCIPGSVPVAIVLLSKLKLKVNDAFKVMVTLFSLTEIWFAHNAEEMYAEILVTADFICLKEPRIAEKFNTLKLDLADFALICSTWVRTAFMDGFPLEFMARILDSVFGVGTSILSSIVFSLIAEFKDEILVQTKRDALFEMLTTIPAMIDKTRLHSIFQRISSLHLEIRSFADSSCKKDWMEYANQPGSLRFETGVGNSCVPGFDSIKSPPSSDSRSFEFENEDDNLLIDVFGSSQRFTELQEQVRDPDVLWQVIKLLVEDIKVLKSGRPSRLSINASKSSKSESKDFSSPVGSPDSGPVSPEAGSSSPNSVYVGLMKALRYMLPSKP